jgi:hypothetical protein
MRPHINFSNVRYTSPLLASSPALIGKKLRIYFDPRDIRVVKAFFSDGTELGVLSAARPWCFTPHSLKVRQEIFKLLAERKLEIREGDNPVEAWTRMRMAQRHNKASVGKMAKQQRLEQSSAANDTNEVEEPYIALARSSQRAEAPVVETGLNVADTGSTDDTPVAPKSLSIRKTLTF